jgi:hypothetical protein
MTQKKRHASGSSNAVNLRAASSPSDSDVQSPPPCQCSQSLTYLTCSHPDFLLPHSGSRRPPALRQPSTHPTTVSVPLNQVSHGSSRHGIFIIIKQSTRHLSLLLSLQALPRFRFLIVHCTIKHHCPSHVASDPAAPALIAAGATITVPPASIHPSLSRSATRRGLKPPSTVTSTT